MQQTGKTIPNCQIEILDAEKNVIKRGTTDANGKVEFTLTYGTYYYREFKAPKGYVLDTTPHMFKISKDEQIIKAIMTNEAEKKKIVKKKEHKKMENGFKFRLAHCCWCRVPNCRCCVFNHFS